MWPIPQHCGQKVALTQRNLALVINRTKQRTKPSSTRTQVLAVFQDEMIQLLYKELPKLDVKQFKVDAGT